MTFNVLLFIFFQFSFSHSLPVHENFESAYTSKKAEDLRKTNQVRIATVVCSAFSVLASTIAFYWFFRMDKRFRHRLVMILLLGDLIRGTVYFLWAAYSLARGAPQTESALCQASGFFIQYGVETAGKCYHCVAWVIQLMFTFDYGVLVIAVHSALQVFKPASRAKSDGLHHYRHYIYAGAFILPTIMASLAFIRSEWGYVLQGVYCTLPIRPFWYLLALQWVPRYLIVLTIFGLAIAIYSYVGFEFRSYESVNQSFKTPITLTNSTLPHGTNTTELTTINREMSRSTAETGRRASSIAHDILAFHRGGSGAVSSGRKMSSAPESMVHMHSQQVAGAPFRLYSNSTPASTTPLFTIPLDQTLELANKGPDPAHTRHRQATDFSDMTATICSAPAVLEADQSSREPSPMSPAQRHMIRQRRRIYRQLRLMFVYPMVYTLMYVIPFVNHCLQYSDYFAAHPIQAIRLSAMIFTTSLGFVDCLIFCIREKPWRSIPTSDGTLLGSFTIWTHGSSGGDGSIRSRLRLGIKGMEEGRGGTQTSRMGRIRSSVRTSASDDQTRIAAEQARIRLDMEKQERLAKFREKEQGKEPEQGKEGRRPTLGNSRRSTGKIVKIDGVTKEGKSAVDKGKGKA